MRTYISESAEASAREALKALGFNEVEAGIFHLQRDDELQWLIDYDYSSWALNEWRHNHWRKVIDFFDGELMAAVLEATGVRAGRI